MMQKLAITIVDVENNGIENVKDNIQESLSNCPYNLKVDFEVSEALFEDREVFIVFNNRSKFQEHFPSLEKALIWARGKATVWSPADISIKQGTAIFIEGKFFDGYDNANSKVVFDNLEFLFGN